MTISKKIKISMIFAISLAVLSTSVVFYRGQLLKQSVREDAFFKQIIAGAFELNALTRDYALHQGDRSRTQWDQRHASLERLLQENVYESDEEKAVQAGMQRSLEAVRMLFDRIIANYDSVRGLTGTRRDMRLESNEWLIAQLTAKTQLMVNDATLMEQANTRKTLAVQNRVFFTILTLSLSMIAIMVLIAFVLDRSVVRALKVLEDGAGAISMGDLDHKIDVRSEDEIGSVSRAFNDMSAILKETHEELRRSHDNLENQVRARTAQLSEANRELESFSYTVSHDLRAPLRAIDGFSKMILDDTGARLDGETRRRFDIVRKNVQLMSQLIDDLLSFSRLGRAEMRLSEIDMTRLAGNVADELLPKDLEKPVEIKVDELPPAYGDRALIRQVLVNLLSNAVKFSKNREGAAIRVGGREQATDNLYYVKDNGAGFDMKYYDKLYGVFQRLHSAGEYEGTGVGLASVQQIVKRHGGRVWAEGEIDKGACFYFTLPRKELIL